MAISRHTGDFTAMVRAERPPVVKKRESDNDEYTVWRNPSEGVSP